MSVEMLSATIEHYIYILNWQLPFSCYRVFLCHHSESSRTATQRELCRRNIYVYLSYVHLLTMAVSMSRGTLWGRANRPVTLVTLYVQPFGCSFNRESGADVNMYPQHSVSLCLPLSSRCCVLYHATDISPQTGILHL